MINVELWNFPKRTVEAKESPTGRVYEFEDGTKYPSITTVLSDYSSRYIAEWRKRVGNDVANEISKRALHKGSVLHNQIENYILKGTEPTPYYFHERFYNMIPVLHEITTVHAVEQVLYSHHLQSAGRLDCLGIFQGKLSIIDFKTSSKVKSAEDIDHYFMQEAAYAVCVEEMIGIPVTQLVVIMSVEGEVEPLVFVKKRNKYIKQFKHHRELYREHYGL